MGMNVATLALPEGRLCLEPDFATLYRTRFGELAAQLYAFTGDP